MLFGAAARGKVVPLGRIQMAPDGCVWGTESSPSLSVDDNGTLNALI